MKFKLAPPSAISVRIDILCVRLMDSLVWEAVVSLSVTPVVLFAAVVDQFAFITPVG